MKALATAVRLGAFSAIVLAVLAGCESTDSGGTVSAGVYYETGLYDPWYYGAYYDDPDIIVTPPTDRPDVPHPSYPIATPPAATPRPTPMPSIPSMPRPSGRR